MQVRLATKHNILAAYVSTIPFANLIFVILCDLLAVASCCKDNVRITNHHPARKVIYVRTNQ